MHWPVSVLVCTTGKDRSGGEFFASGANRQGIVRRSVQRTGQADPASGSHQSHRSRRSWRRDWRHSARDHGLVSVRQSLRYQVLRLVPQGLLILNAKFLLVTVPSVLWYCWLGLLTCKNRLPYNLYCVGGDVKPCSIKLNQFFWWLIGSCIEMRFRLTQRSMTLDDLL